MPNNVQFISKLFILVMHSGCRNCSECINFYIWEITVIAKMDKTYYIKCRKSHIMYKIKRCVCVYPQ